MLRPLHNVFGTVYRVDDREIAVQFSESAQNLSLMQNIYTCFEAFSSSVQLLGDEYGQFFAPGGQVRSDGDAGSLHSRICQHGVRTDELTSSCASLNV